MNEVKVDKISFGCVILSGVLFIYGWTAFMNYNGFNSYLVDLFASLVRLINPSSASVGPEFKSGNFYLSEERMILAVFAVSMILSLLGIIKLSFHKFRGPKIATFTSVFLLSVALLICNVYAVFTSGVLLDV